MMTHVISAYEANQQFPTEMKSLYELNVLDQQHDPSVNFETWLDAQQNFIDDMELLYRVQFTPRKKLQTTKLQIICGVKIFYYVNGHGWIVENYDGGNDDE
jgi:flavorubredoxin